MPKSNKPIVCICGSRQINSLPISLYLDPSTVGCVISGEANGIDTIAKQWARQHNIEYAGYEPNYRTFGKKAPLERDRQMVNACDLVVAFWDGKSSGTAYTINYGKKINRKVIIHLIEECD